MQSKSSVPPTSTVEVLSVFHQLDQDARLDFLRWLRERVIQAQIAATVQAAERRSVCLN